MTGSGEWLNITDEGSFVDVVLRASQPVVVAFESGDCAHCPEHRALLSLAWRQLAWNPTTFRVDAATLPDLAHRYRILGYPTITVFAGGQLLERYPGARDPHSLTRRLQSLSQQSVRPTARTTVRRPGDHDGGASSAPRLTSLRRRHA